MSSIERRMNRYGFGMGPALSRASSILGQYARRRISRAASRFGSRISRQASSRVRDWVSSYRSQPSAPASQYRSQRIAGRRGYRINPYQRRVVRRRGGKRRSSNLYSRSSKRMRRNNRGPLRLQSRLTNGGKLPFETRVKLSARRQNFVSMKQSGAVANQKDFDLTNLTSPNLSVNLGLLYPQWWWMWKAMYKTYLVTGAKIKIKLTKPVWPSGVANAGFAGPEVPYDKIPFDVQPGYWYLRVNYNKGTGSNVSQVGAPIHGIEDQLDEKLWTTLRDFQSDPTVSWKKDTTQVRQKIITTSAGNLSSAGSASDLKANSQIQYELETSQKSVTLSTTFSYRKHFEDKNALKNGNWLSTGAPLGVAGSWNMASGFRLRIGYIGFNSSGNYSYHMPVDRTTNRTFEVDINWAVTFRDPVMGPDGEDQLEGARQLMERERELEGHANPETLHQTTLAGQEAAAALEEDLDSQITEFDSEEDWSQNSAE
uniref:Capsid protein n=1 Tax=Cressdnaviricota sp. TaxID=2748378 RepID=A0A7G8LJ18_9VIRU|nr:capsid protein [Cressdnaviricota sp.]